MTRLPGSLPMLEHHQQVWTVWDCRCQVAFRGLSTISRWELYGTKVQHKAGASELHSLCTSICSSQLHGAGAVLLAANLVCGWPVEQQPD